MYCLLCDGSTSRAVWTTTKPTLTHTERRWPSERNFTLKDEFGVLVASITEFL